MARAMSSSAEWQQAWHTNDDIVYLNAAGQAPMPRVSLEAVQASVEWKKFPHTLTDQQELDLPKRVRASIADLIGAKPEEIALTTGASAGLIALAYGLNWKRGDAIHDVEANGSAIRDQSQACCVLRALDHGRGLHRRADTANAPRFGEYGAIR